MNKLARRVLAFMLMACLLIALVPAVASAETDSVSNAVVYDFELDQNPAMQWGAYDEATNTTTYYGFGQTTLPQGNPGQLDALNKWYADGTLLWNFPHSLNEDGKVANELSFGNAAENPIQWGGAYYKGGTTADKDWTGLKVSTYSKGAATGWNALLLKAPDVGTYDITVEYTKYGGSSSNIGIYLLPYTAAMKEKVETDVEGWNADVSAIVAQGQAADSYRGKFGSWIASGSTPVTGQIADMGQIDVDIEVDEYLMIITSPAGKSAYLQNVTFTPVAEEEIPAEVITRNYSIAGTVNSNTIIATSGVNNADGVKVIDDAYNAGTIDWAWIGTNSADGDGVQLQKGYIYNQTVLANVTGTENDTHAYEAYKLRSPGAGKYNISFATYVPAAGKTTAWSDVYIAEYVEGMDPLSVVTEANYVGAHTPKSSANPTSGKTATTAVGEFTFAADKEYILVHKADGNKYVWPGVKDTENDCFYTANFYMIGFVIEAQEAPITFVPKAYIGTTPYATVAAAAAAAKAGDTIKLAVDFLGNIDLPAGVTLDLNGNDWTVTNLTTTNASEAVIDSVGTGNLVAKNIDLFGSNANILPLAKGNNAYALAEYEMTVVADDYEPVGEATRFWFKLDLADEYLDLIASGDSGLTIGVDLAWGGTEDLAVTFEGENGAEAFAAEWATAYKAGNNVWLYVDITGIDALTSDLTVTPVLKVNNTTLNVGSLVYEIA